MRSTFEVYGLTFVYIPAYIHMYVATMSIASCSLEFFRLPPPPPDKAINDRPNSPIVLVVHSHRYLGIHLIGAWKIATTQIITSYEV